MPTYQLSRAHYTEALEGLGKDISLQMLRIPAGTFTMGFLGGEFEPEYDEIPHEVTVSDFFLSRYLVTQAQWRVVAALPQVDRELKSNPSYFKGNNLPVERVSWYEAVEFCHRLAVNTGRPYRLPSEAEWEYACHAGTTTPFYFGETLLTEVANCKESYDKARKSENWPEKDYRQTTTPVDYFKVSNAFGLSDMHGNVWEWCQDHYADHAQTPTDGSAWISGEETSRRVLRGGSWGTYPKRCRSAYRFNNRPENIDFRNGFRVSCSVSKP